MFILDQQLSIAHHFINEIRDKNTQKNRLLFRNNMERLGNLFAYEISKQLNYQTIGIDTPLDSTKGRKLTDKVVLVCILRAALPLYQGMLNFFNDAESAFIGAYRKPYEENVAIAIDYISTANLDNKTVIIIDPMLATGQSLWKAYQSLLPYGQPSNVHIVSIISSKEGVAFIQKQLPQAHLWLGAIDPELNKNAYIVPGLGDAGDLAFGEKL